MDQVQTTVAGWLAGTIDHETAEGAISLLTAIRHQITCEISGEILDVRASVYIETNEGPGYVMSASAWVENEEKFRGDLQSLGQTVSLVVDGRELHEKGAV